MKPVLIPACVLLACAAGVAGAQSARPPLPGDTHSAVLAVEPVYTPVMRHLMDSAQKLRESIQALAQRPPGPERKVALDQAREALRKTQQAMLDLPAEYRTSGSEASTAGYDPAVTKLMHSADSLRDSIHAMAQRPAGAQRNQAIRDADAALMDIQAAMVNAYDMTTFPRTASAATSHVLKCDHLDAMVACH